MPTSSSSPERAEEFSAVDRFFYAAFQHWLLIVNALVCIYAAVPWVSPLLIEFGYNDLGGLLFRLYTPLCHQAAGSSFELFGHQVAFCHRDTAFYTSVLVFGLLYGLVRERMGGRPLGLLWVALLVLPMGFDAIWHTIGNFVPALERPASDAVWGINWWMRMLTGTLAGLGVVWGFYPRLDRDLRGVGEEA